MVRGMLHVHSTFSYDGHHSLEEIVQYARERNIRFLAMSEHSDGLDQPTFDRYVQECARQTTSDCLVIPGVEFSCEGDLHILGFGLRRLTGERDPVRVSTFVRAQ